MLQTAIVGSTTPRPKEIPGGENTVGGGRSPRPADLEDMIGKLDFLRSEAGNQFMFKQKSDMS